MASFEGRGSRKRTKRFRVTRSPLIIATTDSSFSTENSAVQALEYQPDEVQTQGVLVGQTRR